MTKYDEDITNDEIRKIYSTTRIVVTTPNSLATRTYISRATTASGLIEIAKYVDDVEKSLYLNAAIKISKSM